MGFGRVWYVCLIDQKSSWRNCCDVSRSQSWISATWEKNATLIGVTWECTKRMASRFFVVAIVGSPCLLGRPSPWIGDWRGLGALDGEGRSFSVVATLWVGAFSSCYREAFGCYWSSISNNSGKVLKKRKQIENNLTDLLLLFYSALASAQWHCNSERLDVGALSWRDVGVLNIRSFFNETLGVVTLRNLTRVLSRLLLKITNLKLFFF